MNEHAEARLTPPGHAGIFLGGGFGVLNGLYLVGGICLDVLSLNLCGNWER
jgi:hypothetical protein